AVARRLHHRVSDRRSTVEFDGVRHPPSSVDLRKWVFFQTSRSGTSVALYPRQFPVLSRGAGTRRTAMDTVARITDRTLGSLGLSLIGAIPGVADHVDGARHPAPTAGTRRPARTGAPARPLTAAHRTGR